MANEPTSTMREIFPLRTLEDLTAAHEWLFAQQRAGAIDAKSADALNTTLKGSVYLNAKLKLERTKLFLTAMTKKIEIPPGMLPPMS
jgi:hypothetical protein